MEISQKQIDWLIRNVVYDYISQFPYPNYSTFLFASKHAYLMLGPLNISQEYIDGIVEGFYQDEKADAKWFAEME